MKVVLITGHDALSDRKTGFHFWTDILAGRGIDVRFVTVGASRLSLLKKNAKPLVPPFNDWVSLSYQVKKFTWLPPVHPLYVGKNGFLTRMTAPVVWLYPRILPEKILKEIRDADLFIVESGAGPLLVPRLIKECPQARFVYNASDKFELLPFHPGVIEENKKVLPLFSLIRLNAGIRRGDFADELPVLYVPQAIDKSMFDEVQPNPFASPRNAINIGDMLFDGQTIQALAQAYPDWNFHMFGRNAKVGVSLPNVHEYGEFPFSKIVPYLQHADIGLAPYKDAPGAGYLSQSSLKMVQYTYCRLPIVAPDFAAAEREHVVPYRAGDHGSAIDAFARAIAFDRSSIDRSGVLSWDEMIDMMMKAAMKKAA